MDLAQLFLLTSSMSCAPGRKSVKTIARGNLQKKKRARGCKRLGYYLLNWWRLLRFPCCKRLSYGWNHHGKENTWSMRSSTFCAASSLHLNSLQSLNANEGRGCSAPQSDCLVEWYQSIINLSALHCMRARKIRRNCRGTHQHHR